MIPYEAISKDFLASSMFSAFEFVTISRECEGNTQYFMDVGKAIGVFVV